MSPSDDDAQPNWRTRWSEALTDSSATLVDESVEHAMVEDATTDRDGTQALHLSGGRPRRDVVRGENDSVPPPLVGGPVVVGGGVGGAGATVTTLMVAAALRAEGVPVIAVDGTATGGDLHRRAGHDGSCLDWQSWLRHSASVDELPGAIGDRVPVLRRDSTMPDYLSPAAAAVAELHLRGRVPVVDLGAALASAHSDQVLALAATVIVVVPDRAEAANRLRPVLSALSNQIGAERIPQVHLVVSGQTSTWSPAWHTMRKHLSTRMAGVHGLTFSTTLAWGGELAESELVTCGGALSGLIASIVGSASAASADRLLTAGMRGLV